MAFDWLSKFHHEMEKDPQYAEKALAAYRLGMRGKGAIVGIRIEPAVDCCEAACQLQKGKVYGADEAPKLPLSGCSMGGRCACVYRPVMSYQKSAGGAMQGDL